MLKNPPQIFVWILDTFYNNLKYKNDLTKYLQASCW